MRFSGRLRSQFSRLKEHVQRREARQATQANDNRRTAQAAAVAQTQKLWSQQASQTQALVSEQAFQHRASFVVPQEVQRATQNLQDRVEAFQRQQQPIAPAAITAAVNAATGPLNAQIANLQQQLHQQQQAQHDQQEAQQKALHQNTQQLQEQVDQLNQNNQQLQTHVLQAQENLKSEAIVSGHVDSGPV